MSTELPASRPLPSELQHFVLRAPMTPEDVYAALAEIPAPRRGWVQGGSHHFTATRDGNTVRLGRTSRRRYDFPQTRYRVEVARAADGAARVEVFVAPSNFFLMMTVLLVVVIPLFTTFRGEYDTWTMARSLVGLVLFTGAFQAFMYHRDLRNSQAELCALIRATRIAG